MNHLHSGTRHSTCNLIYCFHGNHRIETDNSVSVKQTFYLLGENGPVNMFPVKPVEAFALTAVRDNTSRKYCHKFSHLFTVWWTRREGWVRDEHMRPDVGDQTSSQIPKKPTSPKNLQLFSSKVCSAGVTLTFKGRIFWNWVFKMLQNNPTI